MEKADREHTSSEATRLTGDDLYAKARRSLDRMIAAIEGVTGSAEPSGQRTPAQHENASVTAPGMVYDQFSGGVGPFTALSAEEQARRRKMVSSANWSARMAGLGKPDAESVMLAELWITGQISSDERRVRIVASIRERLTQRGHTPPE